MLFPQHSILPLFLQDLERVSSKSEKRVLLHKKPLLFSSSLFRVLRPDSGRGSWSLHAGGEERMMKSRRWPDKGAEV